MGTIFLEHSHEFVTIQNSQHNWVIDFSKHTGTIVQWKVRMHFLKFVFALLQMCSATKKVIERPDHDDVTPNSHIC